MTKTISSLIIILCFTSSDGLAQRQKAQIQIPVCDLMEADLPATRGFHLGQSHSEVLSRVENIKNVSIEKRSQPQGQPLLDVVFPANYDETHPDSEFFDIGRLLFRFFNNRVSEFSISYSEFEPRNLADFIKQISSALKLPSVGWKIERQHSASLSCRDFRIEIWDGRDLARSYFQAYAQISFIDKKAEEDLKRLEEQKKRDEKDRKRREEQNRRIFKP